MKKTTVHKKAIVYIDGYNLFFSLKENNWKKYYWLDIEKLSSNLLYPGHYLHKVKFFTSQVRKPRDKKERQLRYLAALRTLNFVKLYYGKFQYNTIECHQCRKQIFLPKEKKTDVSLASHLLIDAIKEECEVQYILSGDSDFTPPVSLLKQHYPQREVYLLCPPKPVIPYKQFKESNPKLLKRTSDDLIKHCKEHKYITEKILKMSLLADPVQNRFGKYINCPTHWK